MTPKVKRAIFILILSEFLVCLGISLVIPVLPFLRNKLHLSAFDMGIMSSLFASAELIASPIIGIVSDKIGRKPVLAVGLLLFTFSEFLFAATNYLWVFNTSRIIGGLSAAMVAPTAMAFAADITTKNQRAKVIGWISAAFSGGLILGPGIGGILAKFDYKMPFWVSGVLGLMSMTAILTLLPKDNVGTLNKCKGDQIHPQDVSSIRDNWFDLFSKQVILLFAMIFISSFGLQGFESIYSLFVNQVFHFNLNNIAIVLTLNGIISLIFQVALFDRLVFRFNETRIIRYCFLFSFAGTIWIIFAHTKLEVIIATLVAFTSFDLLRPAITTLLTKLSSNNNGLINGLNTSLTSIGNIIGPLISGSLLDMNTHYPYIVVAIILGMSYLMTFMIRIQSRANQNSE